MQFRPVAPRAHDQPSAASGPRQPPRHAASPHAGPVVAPTFVPHSFLVRAALEGAGDKAFEGIATEAQEKAYLKRNLPMLDVRMTELGDGHRVASVNVNDAIIRLLQENHKVYERAHAKSEAWKKGDKWKVLETETLDDIDKGSVMRNHAHLMRPAGPDEEDDFRVGVLLYADEVETVQTGYAKSKHKLLGVQVALANLPAEERFDHDNITLCAVARHPAVLATGQAGIFAGVDNSGKRIAKGQTISDDFIEGAAGKWFKVLNPDGTEKWWRLKLHVVVVCGDYPQASATIRRSSLRDCAW